MDELEARLHPPEAKSDDPVEKAKILTELLEEGLRAANAAEQERIAQEALPAPHADPATLDEHIDNALPSAIFVATDRKRQESRKSRKKRNGLRRRARREEEMDVRELAMRILQWGMEEGLSISEVARRLFLSPCTLGGWKKAFSKGRPEAKDVGRKPELADKELRRELITIFGMMGPDVGIPTLQEEFPELSRGELERLKAHYKDAYIKNGRLMIYALRWRKPGTVWAMDFTDLPSVVEGGLRYGLAIR
ncbi:MAG: transposase, partial [Planctomycetes bacterium]|nr:transposase [Planctomycetota bacterium]